MNYQTVVGWQTKKVLRLCEENPSELILTLKKRPRHSPLAFGQIYMKPFRYDTMIPILINIFNPFLKKKLRIPARQHKNPANYFNNLPSPRAELLVAPKIPFPKK